MKVIFRGKARQQGWAQSFCARRNEKIAEAVAGVARFAEKYGVAVIPSFVGTGLSLILSFM